MKKGISDAHHQRRQTWPRRADFSSRSGQSLRLLGWRRNKDRTFVEVQVGGISAHAPPAEVLIDRSAAKAHRWASGGNVWPARLQVVISSGLNNLHKRIRPFDRVVGQDGDPRALILIRGTASSAICRQGFQDTSQLSGHLFLTTRRSWIDGGRPPGVYLAVNDASNVLS